MTDETLQKLLSVLPQIRVLVDEQAEVEGYGSASCVSDPRDFTPDPECSTKEERAAWKLACEAAERGESTDIPRHLWINDSEGKVMAHIAVSGWGLGTYIFRDQEMMGIRDVIDEVLAEVKA